MTAIVFYLATTSLFVLSILLAAARPVPTPPKRDEYPVGLREYDP